MTAIETSSFKRLIGTWTTEGTIFTENGNLKLAGIDSYEFILNENYILHKAAVKKGNEKSETFEIIALSSTSEKATMHYYNSKGETGVMTGSFTENNFTIEGDKIKFEGTINEENTIVSGKWYLQTERNRWAEYIDLKLTKLH